MVGRISTIWLTRNLNIKISYNLKIEHESDRDKDKDDDDAKVRMPMNMIKAGCKGNYQPCFILDIEKRKLILRPRDR